MLASSAETKRGQPVVNLESTRVQPGVNVWATWDQHGVNLGSTWVILGSTWGQPAPPYHQRVRLQEERPKHVRHCQKLPDHAGGYQHPNLRLGTDGECSPRHQTHTEPSSLDSNGII
jgi:hypothetical protein